MDLSINSADTDAFDGSAEPIVYMSDNRMPVMIEFNQTIIYIVFAALVLALLFIIPGVRRTKFTSLLGLLTLLLVGAAILLAIQGTHWLTGSIQIEDAPYSSLTNDLMSGRLEVNIGLSSANVTLIGKLVVVSSGKFAEEEVQVATSKSVNYNERFYWDTPERMEGEHLQALRKGLPYPILTVTEFLSQDADGFNWTRQLRQAGYYCTLALYTSMASWCLMTVIMCLLPVYLPHMMQITGALMMSSVWIYTMIIQSPKSFAFQLGGHPLEFSFGYTVITTFAAGAISMFAGVLLLAIQMSHPHEQITIMDSEQFVNDQKALYNMNLVNSLHNTNEKKINAPTKPVEEVDKPQSQQKTKPTLNRQDSVIIPMADIEENFKSSITTATQK